MKLNSDILWFRSNMLGTQFSIFDGGETSNRPRILSQDKLVNRPRILSQDKLVYSEVTSSLCHKL